MTSPMIEALRASHEKVRDALVAAERDLAHATQEHARARLEHEAFLGQLGTVCSAMGLDVSEIVGSAGEIDASDDRARTRLTPSPVGAAPEAAFENPIALPSAPMSLRWYAGQVLHAAGEELPVAELADAMRDAGFTHAWDPGNPKQLEASLSALPNQVPWIVRGRARGTLALNREGLRRRQ